MRIGGTGRSSGRSTLSGDALFGCAFGQASAAQNFAHTFMRHMYDYGTTPAQVAHVKALAALAQSD